MRMDDLGFKHHQAVVTLPPEFSPRTALLCPYERMFAFKPLGGPDPSYTRFYAGRQKAPQWPRESLRGLHRAGFLNRLGQFCCKEHFFHL